MKSARTKRCPWCHGTGRDNEEPRYRCPDCNGRGRVEVCDECDEVNENCQCKEEDIYD
jgi:DnaJ-class molecular chaperone